MVCTEVLIQILFCIAMKDVTFSIDSIRKVEKILKGSLDLIPSPSVKIQIMGGKVGLRCKDKTLLGVVNKLFKTKCLLTSPNNVLPYYLNFPTNNLNFH